MSESMGQIKREREKGGAGIIKAIGMYMFVWR